MRVCCVQMNVRLGEPEENFARAQQLICEAARAHSPDTIVLPELWNSGFFPKQTLRECSDENAARSTALLSHLARQLRVNIVGGSVAVRTDGGIYNTGLVFERSGACTARYDKLHLFSPMCEERYFRRGDKLCRFTLDGVQCALILCYDLRFPELARALALSGMELLFVAAQWPAARLEQMHILCAARAVENQCALVCCNGCGSAGESVFGGGSLIVNADGTLAARAGAGEQLLCAPADTAGIAALRRAIPVFQDRRDDLS